MDPELDRLIERVRSEIIEPDGLIAPPGYAHIALSLIDAVFSIRARYAGVRRVVTHYCQTANVLDAPLEAADSPGFVEHTLEGFLDHVHSNALDEVFGGNRAKSGGRLKTEICVEVAERLLREGVDSRTDLIRRFDDPEARQAWVGTRGLGWITWQYFGSLNGLQQVKPDIHVIAFVSDTLQRPVSPKETDGFVRRAAAELDIPVRSLEHSIWGLGSKWKPDASEEDALPGNEKIVFTVAGRPPSKAGSGSPLGERSPHRQRVVALLEAARAEMVRSGFKGFGDAPVRLQVEVRTGPGEPPWDAMNLLGGIADVLDSKSHKRIAQPGMLDHLGVLANVGLYDDDRQIREVSYRVRDHPDEAYVVTVTRLAHS